MEKIELSILLPCLNEEKTIEKCILKAKKSIEKNIINAEIIVIDNGSTDQSVNIALKNGAIVIREKIKGYGSALRKGNEFAKGKYVLFADADDTYDLENIDKFLNKIKEGYDLVIGNRFASKMEKGAMPFLNHYIGNPFLSFVGRILFKTKIKDFHCGIRIYNKKSIGKLDLNSNGMEYASEIIAKACLNNYKIAQIPTVLKNNHIKRKPHLKPFRDGFRHLNLMFKIYNDNKKVMK